MSARLVILAAVVLAGIAADAGAQALSWRTRSAWQRDWVFPAGTLEFAANGSVRPRFIQKTINASLDAGTFVAARNNQGNPTAFGGITGAGSNGVDAANILDGDSTTVWSPARDALIKDRWLEIDLGRLVTATQLVLRMQPGSPLREFNVYVADGQEAFFPGSGVKDYILVGRTTQPNREERIVFDLLKEVVDGEQVPRQHVRYVFLELTSAPEEAEGLAELELISLGDNLMLGVTERFGSLVAGRDGDEIDALKVADGNFTTFEDLHTTIFDWRKRGWMRVDLGSTFWLDTIRFAIFRSQLGRSVVGYKLFVSDGSTQASTSTDAILKDLVWQEIAALERNPPAGESEARYIFENHFQPRPVRHILFSNRNNEEVRGPATQVQVAEFQVYGEGFVPGAAMTTNLIDLGSSRNLTNVEWTSDEPDGTAIEIRTRTGDVVEEVRHYFCRNGLECEKRKWDQEVSLFTASGPLVVEQRPDSTWSNWSRPYAFSGESFLSPSPRRYLLVEARLVSFGASLAPTLHSIRLAFTTPIAQRLQATIEPRLVPASKTATYQLTVDAQFVGNQTGFDQILLNTPTEATLRSVTIGADDVALDDLDSVYTSPDTLFVGLGQLLRRQIPSSVTLGFDATVLADNTLFEVFVSNSSRAGRQRVDPATPDAMIVRLNGADRLIREVVLSTPAISPNGDGVNEEVAIDFLVERLLEPRPVYVDVFSVSGRRVARLEAVEGYGRQGLGGRYRATWDATDVRGQRVPPGLYLVRIEVAAQSAKEVRTATVAVAY